MGTGIDGGIDGGSASGGGPVIIPPPPPPPPPDSTFSARVEAMDRSIQLRLGGELVTYQPATGGAVEVTGLFDERYLLVTGDGDGQAGVSTLIPAVFFRLSDLPSDPEFDDPLINIRGIVYRVFERKPDGIGGIILALRVDG